MSCYIQIMNIKGIVMKHGSTHFLRSVVIIIGLIVLAICTIALPSGIMTAEADYYLPLLYGLYLPVIPFFIALYQTLKLLHYIDINKAFSNLSVIALQKIKYCAVVIAAIFTLGSPYIYQVAQKDDAPGVLLLGLIIIGASVVIAVFAAVLQMLLHQAIALKHENDLTV